MKIHVIANPASGIGRTAGRIAALERLLRRSGCTVSTAVTTGPGDALRLARALPGDAGMVVVAGGDGTVNEVINGLAAGTPVAIMATGGANVLARELCLPRDPRGVAAMILAGRCRAVDAGVTATGKRFVVGLSVGFDAAVVRSVQAARTGTLGMRGFVVPAATLALKYKAPQLAVTVDDGPTLHGALAVVANTRIYGGIMCVADRARCDSGHLDVVVLAGRSPVAMSRYCCGALTGRLSRMAGVTYRTGRSVTIAAEAPADCQADGEYLGTTPIAVGTEPASACFVVPA